MTDHFAEGGTSLSSPLWLGMWALVQAHHDAGNSAAGSLGFAAPLIYELAQGQTKAGSKTADDSGATSDFNDITARGEPAAGSPRAGTSPTGWGTPEREEPDRGRQRHAGPDRATGPPPDRAAATRARSWPRWRARRRASPAFYNGNPSAPDPINGSQDSNLALVEGDLGLTLGSEHAPGVLTIQDLSKTMPTGANFLDYEFWWTNPSGDTGPDRGRRAGRQLRKRDLHRRDPDDHQRQRRGRKSSFSPSSTSKATGTFGSGPDGKIEVDVPLSELGLGVGQTIAGPSAYTADGENLTVTSNGFIAQQAGPGNSYSLGEPTCPSTRGARPARGPPGPPDPPGRPDRPGRPGRAGRAGRAAVATTTAAARARAAPARAQTAAAARLRRPPARARLSHPPRRSPPAGIRRRGSRSPSPSHTRSTSASRTTRRRSTPSATAGARRTTGRRSSPAASSRSASRPRPSRRAAAAPPVQVGAPIRRAARPSAVLRVAMSLKARSSSAESVSARRDPRTLRGRSGDRAPPASRVARAARRRSSDPPRRAPGRLSDGSPRSAMKSGTSPGAIP